MPEKNRFPAVLVPQGTFANSGQGYWNEANGSQPIGTQARAIYESTLVTHSLRADGFDASKDGTGRETPLVPSSHQRSRNAAICENHFDAGPCTDGSLAPVKFREDGATAYTLRS